MDSEQNIETEIDSDYWRNVALLVFGVSRKCPLPPRTRNKMRRFLIARRGCVFDSIGEGAIALAMWNAEAIAQQR